MAKACIGTSGWQYKHWKDDFYQGVPAKNWLPHLTTKLNAVELNGSFYRLQARTSFKKWATQVPEDFSFAIRGHRYTTHNKKLLDPRESILKQVEPAGGLGKLLKAVVWQIPPKFPLHLERLQEFCQTLQQVWPSTRHAIEFRHESWMVDAVEGLLHECRIANCISDSGTWKRWDAVTTDLVYVRLHGAPYTYWSDYSDSSLDEWAVRIDRWLGEGREVHVYFDNDADKRAPWNAVSLQAKVGRLTARAAR